MIEAVITYPYIRLNSIDQFLNAHKKYALYRPRHEDMGRRAASYALQYYRISEMNRMHGILVPPFSFSPNIPLGDPWTSVYCSKLVWLSYYFGSHYAFYNDFFLFTPEDLDTDLQKDPNFMLLYKHPEFMFLVNS
jgi:hypothetical protein